MRINDLLVVEISNNACATLAAIDKVSALQLRYIKERRQASQKLCTSHCCRMWPLEEILRHYESANSGPNPVYIQPNLVQASITRTLSRWAHRARI